MGHATATAGATSHAAATLPQGRVAGSTAAAVRHGSCDDSHASCTTEIAAVASSSCSGIVARQLAQLAARRSGCRDVRRRSRQRAGWQRRLAAHGRAASRPSNLRLPVGRPRGRVKVRVDAAMTTAAITTGAAATAAAATVHRSGGQGSSAACTAGLDGSVWPRCRPLGLDAACSHFRSMTKAQ